MAPQPQPQNIDEALDPERVKSSTLSTFLGGFGYGGLIGALVVGAGALVVTAGIAAFSPGALAAAFGDKLGATLLSAATYAGIGGLVTGAAAGSLRVGASLGMATGYHVGRQTERQEMMSAAAEMQAQMEQAMAQTQGKGQKQAMDFSDMPNHPANQPKAAKTAQGQFTSAVLANESQQTEAAR